MDNKGLPKKTSKDFLHGLIKGSLSEIPFLGGPISEFYGLTVTTPLQKRQENWLEDLYQRLIELRVKSKEFEPQNLSRNEHFISIITQATNSAIKTHKEEKLNYLKNAVLSSVESKIEFEDQALFLEFIDSMTIMHIKILMVIEERGIKGISSPTDQLWDISINGFSYTTIIDRARYILQDLDNKGFIEKRYSNLSDSKTLNLSIYLSDFGKKFLKYIEP